MKVHSDMHLKSMNGKFECRFGVETVESLSQVVFVRTFNLFGTNVRDVPFANPKFENLVKK
jgi:hypothetical protein